MKIINKPQYKELPHFGKPSLLNSVVTSSKIRKVNYFKFILKKLTNHVLLSFAYSCPINSWRIRFHRWRGVNIGKGVFIGLHVIIDRAYPEYVILEDGVMLSGGNHLLCHSRPHEYFKGKLLSYVAPIHIKKNSWICINAIVLPNVEIGEGSVIAAGAVVTKNIPANSIARGNPAVVIQKFI
jgi:acetyltransferase-like isoleucine patch superfamily enzyme